MANSYELFTAVVIFLSKYFSNANENKKREKIEINIDGIKVAIENITGSELFSAEIYFLSKLPAVVEPKEVAVVMGMALTLSLLASIYPAWRAAQLDPIESLRFE